MKKTIIVMGKTREDAESKALLELGLDRDDVLIELLETGKAGFLGLGSVDAKIKVTYQVSKTDFVKEFLNHLFSLMGEQVEVSCTETDEGNINVDLSGPDMGIIIGRRGDNLDALQHLTLLALNKGEDNHCRVSIDTESYRKKREEALQRLARKMASSAIKYKKNMVLEPMNAYERHVIHEALSDWRDVSTHSSGTEPNRRVVVSVNTRRGGYTSQRKPD